TDIEELAQRTEDEVREHLAAGKLVEGLEHMSPEYLRGIRRILTVSADTEWVSAPSYLRAAQHAPALNNFGSAMSIIQDELAHVDQEARGGSRGARRGAGGGGLDVHPHARVVRAAGHTQAAWRSARVRLQGQDQRRAAPGLDARGRGVHGGGGDPRTRAPRP